MGEAKVQQRLRVEAGKASSGHFADLWRYRELFYFLAWRDIIVRYKQTVIGFAWAILKPALITVAFTIVFGKLAKLPNNGLPYPVLVLSGLLPWQLFANAFSQSSDSLLSNARLITKVYFPRLIIPAASIIVALVDFLIAFLFLIVLMFFYDFVPSWQIIFLPLYLILALVFSFGAGLWFSTFSVKYRDSKYLVPFLIQFGLYISPVGFTSLVVPEKWRPIYSLNPMVGIIEGFRWTLLDATIFPLQATFISLALASIVLSIGVLRFRKVERSFADII